jgi:hypothetical protein
VKRNSKRTFRKEVNAIAHRVGKNGDIKIVKKAIKRKQGKHRKKKLNMQKWPVQKRLSLVIQTLLMSPLMLWNRVKGFLARRDMRSIATIRFDARGNQVNIADSDSDDDRKMPAKISRKKPKKVADPMNTESSEETDEDEDFQASKEEKAFLKSIDKKENSGSGTDSD